MDKNKKTYIDMKFGEYQKIRDDIWNEWEWYSCRVVYCLNKSMLMTRSDFNLSKKWFALYERYSIRRDEAFKQLIEVNKKTYSLLCENIIGGDFKNGQDDFM